MVSRCSPCTGFEWQEADEEVEEDSELRPDSNADPLGDEWLQREVSEGGVGQASGLRLAPARDGGPLPLLGGQCLFWTSVCWLLSTSGTVRRWQHVIHRLLPILTCFQQISWGRMS